MGPLKLNLNQLVTFYLVAKEESFSSAAEKLYLTQPAVTQQIRTLERCAGVKLVDVRRQKVCLTKAGKVLLEYAGEIYEQARDAESFLSKVTESSLAVGVSTTVSPIVASVAGEFEQLFPDTKLTIRSAPSHEIVGGLLELEYDIALVISLDYGKRKLESTKISDGERLVLVVSPSFPESVDKPLKLADLCHYSFFLPRDGSATREILLNAFEAEGIQAKRYISVEADYLECSKRLAEMGGGIALMPDTNVRSEVAEGRLKIIPLINDIKVGVDALYRRDAPPHPHAKRFIQLTKKAFNMQNQHIGVNRSLATSQEPISAR